MIEQKIITEQKVFFTEEVRLTNVKEYGYTWDDFINQRVEIPGEGLRFDIHFEGFITGEGINGSIKGVDYLTVRADGRLFLDLYAEITTVDDARIFVKESGINVHGQLSLTMDFHTNDERYVWMNQEHIWATGDVSFEQGSVRIKAYRSEEVFR